MNNFSKSFYPLGRAAIGLLFVVSGLNKALAFSYVTGWMASMGVPFANLALAGAIAIEVIGGLMLVTGIGARLAAIALALFLIPVTAIFHAFWAADAAHFQDQLTHFLKNVAIFGGMLLVLERERATATAGAEVKRTTAAA
jgi:putative oxidoreductase